MVPSAIPGLAGVMASDTSTAGPTFSVVEPETEPEVAVIVALPWAMLVARPWVPEALLMVATAVFEELQLAEVVRFWVEPSL